MPYIRKGKSVFKRTNGLKKIGTSTTIAKAKKYLKALYHAESGGKFTKRKKK